MLKKKALIILLIVFRVNIVAQTTSIEKFGVDLVAETLPNIPCLLLKKKNDEEKNQFFSTLSFQKTYVLDIKKYY